MSDLRSMLETATDRLESPGAVTAALAAGRRRRARHRAVSAVAAVALVGLALTGLMVRDPDGPGPDVPVDSPTSPPSPTSSPEPSQDSSPATQPLWDPFEVPSMPAVSSQLPPRLEPPAQAPSVLEEPMGLAVLAWPREDQDLLLLDVDGSWRSVPDTAEAVASTLRPVVRPAISHDGTRVAMSTEAGLLVVDVKAGSAETLPWVGELAEPWDTAPDLLWTSDDDGLVIQHWRRPWLAALDGAMRELPYPGAFMSLAVDPSGPVYQNDYERRLLVTWDGDEVSREAPFLQCERMVALDGLVACTTGSLEPFRSGPVVVDSASGELLAYAPIKDRSSVYSDNGRLTAMGFLDQDTVLLLAGPADFRAPDWEEYGWHLLAWDFATGEFALLSSGGPEMRDVVVAAAVLAGTRS